MATTHISEVGHLVARLPMPELNIGAMFHGCFLGLATGIILPALLRARINWQEIFSPSVLTRRLRIVKEKGTLCSCMTNEIQHSNPMEQEQMRTRKLNLACAIQAF